METTEVAYTIRVGEGVVLVGMVSKSEDGRGEVGVVEADCSSAGERESEELVDTKEQTKRREYLAVKKLKPRWKKEMETCLSQGNVLIKNHMPRDIYK